MSRRREATRSSSRMTLLCEVGYARLYIPSCESCLHCCLCKSWKVNAGTRPREQSESLPKNTRILAGILYRVWSCLGWNEQCSWEKNFIHSALPRSWNPKRYLIHFIQRPSSYRAVNTCILDLLTYSMEQSS
jgi:hypothetical protein